MEDRELPSLVIFSRNFADGAFFSLGNIISPIIIYRKDTEIQEPFVVDLPREVIGAHDIQDRVSESIRTFVFEKSPDELVVIMEGFFLGDGSGDRCISLVYSCPQGERYWMTRISDRHLSEWREILIQNSLTFSNLYAKATYRWN